MKFSRRQVQSLSIKKDTTVIYICTVDKDHSITVFAHEDDETNSQLLGVEVVNKATGEVTTQRINLPVTDMYIVSVIEILEIES